MNRFFYTAALSLLLPLVMLYLLWRSRHQPEYRTHWGERFGFAFPARPASTIIWIHAVSVGETRAAEPLIVALRATYPQHTILLTHMTPTGRATVIPVSGLLRCYLPYDYSWAVVRFLRYFRPVIGILIETEVWPNTVTHCHRMGIPLALVNARLSERSFAKAQRLGSLVRNCLARLAITLAQTQNDANRLAKIGASNIVVTGNLKFDIRPTSEMVNLAGRFRKHIGTRPVLVAASTREGEEVLILDALVKLQNKLPTDLLLIIVPRHPQRFDEVASLVTLRNLSLQRRSDHATMVDVVSSTQVFLGDSMGELFAYYGAADLAFIGGSLLPLGGQNLIEACAVGCPVLIGPHTFNFLQASEDAIKAGAAQRIGNADELLLSASRLFSNPEIHTTMSQCAQQFAQNHRGATSRTLAALQAFISN